MSKFKLQFYKLLAAILITLFVNSCDPGCVLPHQFDSESRYISSNPEDDGVFGSYDNETGGQSANWTNTGLRSDGTQLVVEISGAWTAWNDGIDNNTDLNNLPLCTLCAKRDGVTNCICEPGQKPKPETDYAGNVVQGVNCNDANMQDDPDLCTCTKQHGSTDAFGTYYIQLNSQTKNETPKLPDEQDSCRFNKGLGLYVGFFGRNGSVLPLRVYQAYSTVEVCDLVRNASGLCLDSKSVDQTRYLYSSANGRIPIRDDKGNNDGSDTNPTDDEYHQAGEYIKMIINDRYYSDNYDGYNANFVGGFLRERDSGLFEFIVGMIEDQVLGKVNLETNAREGGAIQFLYNSIVQDSYFISIVRMLLTIYIVLFGIWVLSGALQISLKEMTKRIMKISLVIFFTTSTSWYFYNQLVIGTFKDGMDSIISIFMNASDSLVDKTSLVVTSQLERANSISYATRFSYVDLVVKKLFSESTTKKIWSLFFGEWFGFLYIPMIYALIFSFVYVMLLAAFAYISALLRLVFVLSLGPIFIITVLFNKTDEIFKRWISFMASQSIQMICLFLIIYLFLVLIDRSFTDLLYFGACVKDVEVGSPPFMVLSLLLSDTNGSRSLPYWITSFAQIGGLIFLLYHIMQKIPGFAGHLVSVSGQAADSSGSFINDTNKGAFGIANNVIGKAIALSKGAAKFAASGAVTAARNTGVGTAVQKMREAIPFRGPLGRYRDYKIDQMIKDQKKSGIAKGLSGKDLENHIRKGVFGEIDKKTSIEAAKGDQNKIGAAENRDHKMALLGIDNRAVLKRLDEKLVKEPMKKAISDEAKKMKKEMGSGIPLGRDAYKKELTNRLGEWADKNSVNPDRFKEVLAKDRFQASMRKEGALDSKEAAKLFANDKAAQNKYLLHLQEEEVVRRKKMEDKSGLFGIRKALYSVKNAGRTMQGSTAYNPKLTRENFLIRTAQEEAAKRDSEKVIGQLRDKISNDIAQSAMAVAAYKHDNKAKVDEMVRSAQVEALNSYFDEFQKLDRNNMTKEQFDDEKGRYDKLIDASNLFVSENKSASENDDKLKEQNKQLEEAMKKADEFREEMKQYYEEQEGKAPSGSGGDASNAGPGYSAPATSSVQPDSVAAETPEQPGKKEKSETASKTEEEKAAAKAEKEEEEAKEKAKEEEAKADVQAAKDTAAKARQDIQAQIRDCQTTIANLETQIGAQTTGDASSLKAKLESEKGNLANLKAALSALSKQS